MISNAIEVILFIAMTTAYMVSERFYLLKPALARLSFPLVRNRSNKK